MTAPARIGVLIGPKGRGSNFRAIAEACRAGQVPGEVVVVVSPTSQSPALDYAESVGITTVHLSPKEEDYAERLRETLCVMGVEWVCLAGYLRLLPAEVLHAYPSRILNIHPALLPKFGGKGMYGIHVHEAVLAAGESESGCTVHWVSEQYDEGEAILQLRCPVLPDDTPETLAARVLSLEHQAYPQALARVIGDARGG